MNPDTLGRSNRTQAALAIHPSHLWHMDGKKAVYAIFFLLLAAATTALNPAPVLANGSQLPQMGAAEIRTSDFYGLLHARHTLDELKDKLHLTPKQVPLWDAWSSATIEDSRQQIERSAGGSDESMEIAKDRAGSTIPERMARSVSRLHAETAWMEERLGRLEAEQTRTVAIYRALNADQRNIFDKFCQESPYIDFGHDLDENWHRPVHHSPMT